MFDTLPLQEAIPVLLDVLGMFSKVSEQLTDESARMVREAAWTATVNTMPACTPHPPSYPLHVLTRGKCPCHS